MLDDFELLALRAPAGAGQENDPGDIEALDLALRRARLYEPPPEYADAPQRYATETMIDAVKRLQSENALKVDGYALPGGPTERAINNALLAKPRGAGLLFEPLAPLGGPVGDGFANARADVAAVQRGLGALGYGPEDPHDRPHGLIDAATLGGVAHFQRDRGLTPDGWMAPGGETERALHEALNDLARTKGRDWLAYAERAGKAQAKMARPLSAKDNTEDDSAATPAAWHGAPPPFQHESRTLPGRDDADEGRVEPAQTAPGDYIVPGALWLFGLLAGAEAKRRADAARQGLDGREEDGGRVENIPPQIPNEPFRGPDPARPPLDPREASPPPYPAAPPKPAPDKVENIPPRIDQRDFILITPDQSEEMAKHIYVENRGDETTRGQLSIIAESARNLQKLRPQVEIMHLGGSRNEKGEEVKEHYESNRNPVEGDPKGRKGSSLADLTLDVDRKYYLHISFYRPRVDGSPIPIEVDQARRLAYNSRRPNIVVMIENKRGREAIDQRALEHFLATIVDALLAGRGKDHINVRDPAVRDRIIRYFDAYKAK